MVTGIYLLDGNNNIIMNYKIFKLRKCDYKKILKCLGNGFTKNVSLKDRKFIQKIFDEKWIGYGAFIENIEASDLNDDFVLDLIGYCFIKYPKKRPETMTIVRKDFRNQGIATDLRNYALNRREFIGHIIYSSVKLDNPASFKSIIKSGFNVFDVTKDGYIQLIKILNY
jgi:RimJ/RimL family protein N-acetyltransferase